MSPLLGVLTAVVVAYCVFMWADRSVKADVRGYLESEPGHDPVGIGVYARHRPGDVTTARHAHAEPVGQRPGPRSRQAAARQKQQQKQKRDRRAPVR